VEMRGLDTGCRLTPLVPEREVTVKTKKPGRISDIVDICNIRLAAGLSCRNCIFYDSAAKRCPHTRAIEIYKVSEKEIKARKRR